MDDVLFVLRCTVKGIKSRSKAAVWQFYSDPKRGVWGAVLLTCLYLRKAGGYPKSSFRVHQGASRLLESIRIP